jgi:hypothetical protein
MDLQDKKLSIVVTNHKTPELLKLCLESIPVAVGSLDYEIFVLDAEAEEETDEMMAEKFPEIKYKAFKENTGYAKLVNIGIKEATGKYLAILNADMVLTKDALVLMVEEMDRHPEIGILGPQLLNLDGSIQESCFHFHHISTIIYRRTFLGKTKAGRKEIDYFSMRDFDHKSVKEVDWMMGTALLVRVEAIKKVGLMDERFFVYFEDTDWCRRFELAGFKVIYYPTAKMYHYHRRVSKKTSGLADLLVNRYTWVHIISALKYFWKYR